MRSLLKRRVSLFDRDRRGPLFDLSVPSGCVDGADVVWAAPQVRNRKNAKVNQTDVIGQMASMSVADVGYQGHVTTIKVSIF